jgi:hypothetical protein
MQTKKGGENEISGKWYEDEVRETQRGGTEDEHEKEGNGSEGIPEACWRTLPPTAGVNSPGNWRG